ncbi:DUF3100 domain-containing protein [Streptomyces sp. B-S-A8]|uniref:DUF3100 domain-containing protein n=1 Tax=Streptomyces solicavernae TaxID=3043614 RepID=A0ABT6RXT0_9ACTN|nr:DUF3100 domain-containing protein [Streptomyces sp. B-S-A8]MDI3388989.1 DUF3100 domain-containing protein [Streptomyces sp. B-S-A8]
MSTNPPNTSKTTNTPNTTKTTNTSNTSTHTPRSTTVTTHRLASYAPLVLTALVLTAVAELIGPHTFDLGVGEVTLHPLVWGILIGGVVSVQKVKALPVRVQQLATQTVQVGILLLSVRLSFLVGENLPVLADAGPALLLQELGHLFGTVVFSLPLAVLLRMGRPAVGACFSIDREGSFAIVSERYGADSDEYRGVLSMYVFGTIVGGLYVTLLASFLAGTGVFDPLALAMGTGVGSGSVMAASSAAIAAQHPELADQILALAAVSNLITSLLGLYVGMYVALPMAERFYRFLARRRRQPEATAPAAPEAAPPEAAPPEAATPVAATPEEGTPRASLRFALPLVVVLMLLSTVLFNQGFDWRILAGYVLMTAVVLAALALRKYTKLSPIIGVTTLGILLSSPWSPVGDQVSALLKPVEFLALTTPVLVLAGLGLGKDFGTLRRVGWRIVLVGLVSFAASFVVSALIAEVTLGVG